MKKTKKNNVVADLHAAVASQEKVLKDLAVKIHDHPELGFEETRACAWQTTLLKRWKFKVTTPWAGMKTAYRAVYGNGKPVFCFMSEYDALPVIGHGCGHNLIGAASLGAAYALSKVLNKYKIKGSVVLLGTPAEESRGGKVQLIANRGMNGVDAVIMAHPSYRTVQDCGCTAIRRYRVHFKGLSTHAAATPEKGRNALDAVMLLFQGVNAWRQQLPESSRMHGIVLEGGVMPNIIPDAASGLFYLRSPDDRILQKMQKRFLQIVRGAALMTETSANIEPWLSPYKARWPNATLNSLYLEAARQCGLQPETAGQPGRGSSDFGDVSQKAPGAHVYFGIARGVVPGHSIAFRKAARSPYGLRQMIRTAEALANVGYRYMSDDNIRRAVRCDYLEDKRRRLSG